MVEWVLETEWDGGNPLADAVYARDPDGNLIELLQPDPEGPFAR